MLKAIEAMVDEQGHVRLLGKVHIKGTHRAILTILDDTLEPKNVTAFLSEKALSDWETPEEEEAWKYLQSDQ